MKINLIILTILLTVFTYSCEEAFNDQINSVDEAFLVVDAQLTNERTRHEVRLSLTFNNINEEPPPVTNAVVLINDGTNNFFLVHDNTSPGVYRTDTLQALFGKFYTLYIIHEEKEYFAFATSAIGTPLAPLTIEEIEPGIFEFINSEGIPSITEVRAVWEEENSQGQMVEQSKEGFFYTLDVIDINKTFAPEKEPFTFPRGAVLHRKKYSLTEDHQNFLRSFLAEVDWRGGGFDAAAGNVLTNLSEGAVGFFSVSMVAFDSTTVE
ncbi:MAG: DUF4249 family protein [Cyclobacteriaceae bacterium]